jgi:two-component system chemotaxis sensor kinase CheA
VQRLADAFADRGGERVAAPAQDVAFFDDEPEAEPEHAEGAPPAPPVDAAADAPQAPAPTRATTAKASTKRAARVDFVRVDATKIGGLMDLAGELGLACAAVTHHPDIDTTVLEDFGQAAHRLELLVRELQNDLEALRLVPVAPVFQRLSRVVEDAARRTGKDVDLVLRGEDTEVDRVMIDALQDPLVHALRNAVDHGLESTEERLAAGKPARGKIVLSATYQAGEVTIDIKDDGRGLQRERILERARERGLCTDDATPDDEEIFQFIFLPGFSTKVTVDSLSGRGVGMDVLKTTVENLRGHVQVRSTPGQGTRFTLKMPLTLAFVEAMVVRERDRLFALPIERVFEVSKINKEDLVHAASGEQALRVRNTDVPLLWLHEYWNEAHTGDLDLEGRVVVVVQTNNGILALPVDEIMGNQQVMLKPLRGPLQHIRAAAGCGMLRTGDVAIALDCDRLHA